jgi:murein DD-endopeptidase MepM/ murein hydrolase activator NlpD
MIFSENAATQKHTSQIRAPKVASFSTIWLAARTTQAIWGQIGIVIEPQRLAVLQLGSFLAVALSWQFGFPSVAAEIAMEKPVLDSAVVNHYRQSESPYSAGHRGVDYDVELGQEVFAPASGTVHFVGEVVDRHLISLAHDSQLLTAFEPVCSKLSEGDLVSRGQLIGEVCEGRPSYQPHCQNSPCLHFSVRKNGEYLSPLWFTKELKASRLLPWIEPEAIEAMPSGEL